jgi:MFS family permease
MAPRPWARRNRGLLVSAYFISTSGDWLYRLALPLLVLRMTGSAVSAAFTYALEFAPYIGLSLVAGVVADRVDRRRLLIVGDGCAAILVGVLVALIGMHLGNVWVIYVCAFALSSVRPFYHPAFQGLLPALVPDEQLPSTNSQVQATDSLLTLVGPVVGAGAIAALGVQTALWLDCASFVASALLIVFIRAPRAGRRRRVTWKFGTDLAEGVRYLFRDRVTLWASILMAGTNVGLYLIEANLIYYAVTLRGFSFRAVGVIFGAQGAGSLIGAVLAPHLAKRAVPGRLIVGSMVGAGVMSAFLAAPLPLVAIAVAWAAVGAFTMLIVVTWFTLRQRIVPGAILGRVVALSRMLSFTFIPLGAVVGGLIVSAQGGAMLLAMSSALIQVGVAIAACLTPLWKAGSPSVLGSADAASDTACVAAVVTGGDGR